MNIKQDMCGTLKRVHVAVQTAFILLKPCSHDAVLISVVSRVPVTVTVRPLGYLTWGNAFHHIFEVRDSVLLRPMPL